MMYLGSYKFIKIYDKCYLINTLTYTHISKICSLTEYNTELLHIPLSNINISSGDMIHVDGIILQHNNVAYSLYIHKDRVTNKNKLQSKIYVNGHSNKKCEIIANDIIKTIGVEIYCMSKTDIINYIKTNYTLPTRTITNLCKILKP